MTDLKEQVGARIAALRREAGLTQAQVSDAAGMSRRWLGAIERGEQAPTVDTLERLAQAMRVHPRRFFELEQENPPTPGPPKARLVNLLVSLTEGVAAEHLERIERLLRAYFKDVERRKPKRERGTRKKSRKGSRGSQG